MKKFFNKLLRKQKNYENVDDEESRGSDVDGEISIPIKETIFTYKEAAFSRKQIVKIYSPGVVLSRAVNIETVTVGLIVYNTTFVDAFDKFYKELESEINKYKALSHENVCKFIGVYKDYPRVGIITEYYNRNLSMLISKSKGKLNWKKKVRILHDISKGMKYLHDNDVFHRNLSCEHVVIDKKNNCKIFNFVLSKFNDEQNKERKIKKYGSYYQAPELTLDSQETMKSDVFSFGIIMYELLIDKLNPFDESYDIPFKIANDPTLRPQVPSWFKVTKQTAWWVDFMKRCWEYYPHRRPHFENITSLMGKKLAELK